MSNKRTFTRKGFTLKELVLAGKRIPGFPVAAGVHIYSGSLVQIDSSGYLEDASDSNNKRVLGVAGEEVDNSGGANGDLYCNVILQSIVELNVENLTQSNVGEKVYVKDSDTVQDWENSTNKNPAGVLIYIQKTKGLIQQ
jgi:hypothetical protein